MTDNILKLVGDDDTSAADSCRDVISQTAESTWEEIIVIGLRDDGTCVLHTANLTGRDTVYLLEDAKLQVLMGEVDE